MYFIVSTLLCGYQDINNDRYSYMNILLLETVLAVFAFALYQNAGIRESVCYQGFSSQASLLQTSIGYDCLSRIKLFPCKCIFAYE